MSTQCRDCFEIFDDWRAQQNHRCTAPFQRDARRYQWLRRNPAFETESLLGGLTPEQFDAIVDKRMQEEGNANN